MQVKDRVLAALEASRGTYLSGQALAQQLQVSRNAVWKAISQLRESGYPIQAVSHRGYCLDVDSPLLSPQSIARHLAVPGLQVEVAQTVSSTNTLLRQRAEEGAPEGLVLAAVEQTAGKGRQGHSFFSPPDTGLYLSLLLRPKLSAQDALLLTTCAAAAVALAIEACAGVEAQIKWVNDVYIDGKKVCGILTEGISDFETGQIEPLILGIGINTTVKDFPAELLATAGAAEGTYSKSALAAETITQALGYIEDLDSASFLPAYKEKSLVIGKTVTVYQGRYKVNPEDEITGVPARVLDIADDGGLIVLYADGHQEKLVSGEISIRI